MTTPFRDAVYAPELLFIAAKEALGHDFFIGRFAVTFDEFDYFCQQTGQPLKNDEDWGRQCSPAIHVSWSEAQAYVLWLTVQTGRVYLLPGYAEWKYAARAGTVTTYWWGDQIEPGDANYLDTPGFGTFPVASLGSNPWGLYNVLGNVDEWLNDSPESGFRMVGGGNWCSPARDLRPDLQRLRPETASNNKTGFRVLRVA
jgi:formylglycine-generating enzyme required for sulfatase activity